MAELKKSSAKPPPSPIPVAPTLPETPPIFDPTFTSCARLTPNLRELIQGFNHGVSDTNVPVYELFASPDPVASFNSLQFAASPRGREPIITPGITPGFTPGTTPGVLEECAKSCAERKERAKGARAQMNALFAFQSPVIAQDGQKGQRESGEAGAENDGNERDSNSETYPSSGRTSTPVDSSSISPSIASPFVKEGTQESHSAHNRNEDEEKEEVQVEEEEEREHSTNARGGSRKKRASGMGSTASGKFGGYEKQKATKLQPAQMAGGVRRVPETVKQSNTGMGNMGHFTYVLLPGGAAITPTSMLQPMEAFQYRGNAMAYMANANQAGGFQYNIAGAQGLGGGMIHPMAGGMVGFGRECGMRGRFEGEEVGRKRKRKVTERSSCTEEQARENRAQALKRLRHKKSLRTQQNLVRYACRKRIAMVRPRVNGRFATKEEVEKNAAGNLKKE